MRIALSLIESVVAGSSATMLVEVAAHRQSTITPATIEQWKKDLRKLTKIYKDIKPGEEDESLTLAKFNEARKIYNTFKRNFENWVYVGLLGMPHTKGLSSGHEYWATETPAMAEVNRLSRGALHSMDHDLFPEGWDFRAGKHLPTPWKLTDREKTKQIGRYQRGFNAAFKAIAELLKRSDGVAPSKMPETITMDIAGFHVRIEKPHKKGSIADPAYIEKDTQETINTLKRALPMLKSKASSVYPRLVKLGCPIVYDAEVDLDRAATYDQFGKVITLKACGINKMNPASTARVIAHELGHHVYKTILSNDAVKFWETAVKGNYGSFDLDRIAKLWPDPNESLISFIFRIQDAHPDIFLQMAAYAEGHLGVGGTRLNTREDFFKKVTEDPPAVMKNPITAYAHKNPEEAFCEALSSLIIYGPRSVFPLVRSWLRTTLPELKVTEKADDAIDRVLILQESPTEVIESYIKAN